MKLLNLNHKKEILIQKNKHQLNNQVNILKNSNLLHFYNVIYYFYKLLISQLFLEFSYFFNPPKQHILNYHYLNSLVLLLKYFLEGYVHQLIFLLMGI